MPAERESIAIVGAGFAGLAMGIRLKQAGRDDFIIYERREGLGGTWYDNRYPGCACDVPSHLYSFSFEPKPDWSRSFAPQKEILAYLEHCCDKYGLRQHLRLGVPVTSAKFDAANGCWTLGAGSGPPVRHRHVVFCTGGLSRPALPDIPGLASFTGQVMHSARWDETHPLEGKAVAVVGTGASAIQIVPSIAPRVARLHVFQRTPPWIVPKPDGPIGKRLQGWYTRFPWLQRLARLAQYWQREALAPGFFRFPGMLRIGEWLANRFRAQSVADPALRAKLTPHYRMGCKRVLPSNDWYPALQRPNVELVTEGIQEIRAKSVVTRDGRERLVDTLVLATGFQAAEAVAPFEVRGLEGRELNEVWRDGPEAYLGTTVAGFPNLFFIVGPNTGLGHTSMIFMIESQAQYILSCLQTARAQGLDVIDVRPEAQDHYNRTLQKRLEHSVWNSGCMSWYLTRSGRNTTLWPGFTFEFRVRTRRFDAEAYSSRALTAPPATATPERQAS